MQYLSNYRVAASQPSGTWCCCSCHILISPMKEAACLPRWAAPRELFVLLFLLMLPLIKLLLPLLLLLLLFPFLFTAAAARFEGRKVHVAEAPQWSLSDCGWDWGWPTPVQHCVLSRVLGTWQAFYRVTKTLNKINHNYARFACNANSNSNNNKNEKSAVDSEIFTLPSEHLRALLIG